jgi:hypothetical protein
VTGLNVAILAAQVTQRAAEGTVDEINRTAQIVIQGLPMVVGVANDPSSAIRAQVLATALAGSAGFEATAETAEVAQERLQTAKEEADIAKDISLELLAAEFEVQQLKRELETTVREEPVARLEMFTAYEELQQSINRFNAQLAGGLRLYEELLAFRRKTAAATTDFRYKDLTFRIFRNDALQKYRAQFDLAAHYVYLAATAYDYETNLLGSDQSGGQQFLTKIVRERSLGQFAGGEPVPGSPGLADPLGQLAGNFDVLKGQLGFNNPQTERARFSLRSEAFRIDSDETWGTQLENFRVDNLWSVPEFRRYARPFAAERDGAQPGLVIPFSTEVVAGLNLFGNELGPGDAAFDPSRFATKIRTVHVLFRDYDDTALSRTPRVYLLPVGADRLRSPSANEFAIRDWTVIDQALPPPFLVSGAALQNPAWIPLYNTLPTDNSLGAIRQFSAFLAYKSDPDFEPDPMMANVDLVGRSVWNTRWVLIIPGQLLAANAKGGLDTFVGDVSDIELLFSTYSYRGG